MANRDETLVFCHEQFRKNSNLSGKQQELVREEVEAYFGRFYQTVNIIGGEVLPAPPKIYELPLSTSPEENALRMRTHLELPKEGPIGNLIEILENKGILVYLCDIPNDDFSGMNDVNRELGVRRSVITNDMIGVCKEYGISMYMLVMRVNKSGIINEYVARNFYINANKAGWRKNEPTRIKKESPRLFYQLVYRAVTENEITVQRGAELLHASYEEVVENCSTMEV